MRRIIRRIFDWTYLVPVLTILAVLSLMLAVFAVAQFTRTRTDTARVAADTARELCQTVDDQRAVLADLLEVVLADDGSEGLPLTALPQFTKLDPPTQDYLRALEAASSTDDPNGLDDRLRRFAGERLVPQECR